MEQPIDYHQQRVSGVSSPAEVLSDERIVIPVIEEQVRVDKQLVETGTVRISKTVHQEDVTVEVPVTSEEVEVERVALNQYVDVAPAVRYEGDTMVIPVMREVVEKRLILVEELRVTRRQVSSVASQPVTLLREEVVVERVPAKTLPTPSA